MSLDKKYLINFRNLNNIPYVNLLLKDLNDEVVVEKNFTFKSQVYKVSDKC